MKEAIKSPFISMFLISIISALTSLSYANEKPNIVHSVYLTANETLSTSDTTQTIQLRESNEFGGIVVVDDKVEPNHSKIKNKEFTKRVKKMVIRKNATPEDVKKYGTNALNGIMFITTK